MDNIGCIHRNSNLGKKNHKNQNLLIVVGQFPSAGWSCLAICTILQWHLHLQWNRMPLLSSSGKQNMVKILFCYQIIIFKYKGYLGELVAYVGSLHWTFSLIGAIIKLKNKSLSISLTLEERILKLSWLIFFLLREESSVLIKWVIKYWLPEELGAILWPRFLYWMSLSMLLR